MADVKPPFADPKVAAAFSGFSDPDRKILFWARALIFDTAAETDGVGPLTETLKWGQPSYLTQATKSGTTIRLAGRKSGGWGLYVHCQTSVMTDFRNVTPVAFTFDGNRGVLFDERETPNENALRMLIRSALTYHQSR